MAIFANLTVKKFDGTTDVVYTAVSPAAGEGSPAIFKNQTIGASFSQQPEYRFSGKGRLKKGVPFRVTNSSYKWPRAITNPTTGEISVSDGVNVFVTVEVNQNMTPTEINEAVYQACNLTAAAAVKAAHRDGYSFF